MVSLPQNQYNQYYETVCRYDARGRMVAKKLPGAGWSYYVYDKGDRLVLTQDGNQRERNEWSFRMEDALGRKCLAGVLTGTYNAFGNPLGSVQVVAARDRNAETYGALHGYQVGGLTIPSGAEVQTVNWWDDYACLGHEEDMPGSSLLPQTAINCVKQAESHNFWPKREIIVQERPYYTIITQNGD